LREPSLLIQLQCGVFANKRNRLSLARSFRLGDCFVPGEREAELPHAESLTQAGDDRLIIHNLFKSDPLAEFAEDVRRGLSSHPKHLFSEYPYDELGSQLFDAISLLPEYYLTRAENEILMRYSDEIVNLTGRPSTLIEIGRCIASKSRLLIEALLRTQSSLLFIPVDTSASALESSSRIILKSYPHLRVEGYVAEYFNGLKALSNTQRDQTLALFLGSNISNFEPAEAKLFLRAIRGVLRQGDALLLGADLKKDRQVLEAAYNDALGVTAVFYLNILGQINRELGGHFDLGTFCHQAFFNEGKSRIEIYLQSNKSQTVNIDRLDLEVRFTEGELIHVENSYKYDLNDIAMLALQSGFKCERRWLDELHRFSSNLLVVEDDRAGIFPRSGKREAILIDAIKRIHVLGDADRKRLIELTELRSNESLAPSEHHELLEIQQRLEELHAERMKVLEELAELRSITLDDIIRDLGINFPDNALGNA
jgi:dimethylhistidine N-methyltransferase